MVLGFVAWSVAGAFVLAVSYLAARALRTDRPSLNALIFIFLTILVPTAFLMLAGLAGILRPWLLAAIGAAGLAAILVVARTRRELCEMRAGAGGAWALARSWWASLPLGLRWLTAIALALSAARFTFLVLALPPFTWDSLTYHLTNVAEWIQRGRITTFDTPVDRIWSPANYEVFAVWFVLFLKHDVIIEVAGLPAYLLACAAVYAIGRTLSLGRGASLLAALAYASTPALLLATTATKNDPIMAALFLMMLALGLDLAVRSEVEPGRDRAGQVVVLAAAWLLALGTKPYVIHLTVGLVVAWVLAYLAAGRRAGWRTLPGALLLRLRGNPQGFRWAAGALLTGALLLGSYWYLRNWAVTGNPFYPYGLAVEGAEVIASAEKATPFDLTNFLANLRSFLERFGDKQQRIMPDLPYTTGWGWVAYGLGLPALVWGTVRRWSVRLLLAGFAAALLVLFFSSPDSPWNMRYAIWFPALMALAIGSAFEGLFSGRRWPSLAFGALFVAASGANFLMMLNYNAFSPAAFQAMLSLPARERESADLESKVPEEYRLALEIVTSDDRMGYNVHGNGFLYPLYRADYSQHLVYVPIPQGSTCAGIADAIEARGTRYLFVAPEHTEDWILSLLNQCATEKDVLRERVRGLYVVKRQ